MKKILLATALLAASAVACGGSSNPITAVVGPQKAQDAAIQPSEAKGLTKCDTSGNMDQTLTSLKKSDPSSYDSTLKEWNKLKAGGATDAYFAIYASDKSTCSKLSAADSKPGAKVLGSLVVEFKDTTSAATAYKGGAFGIEPGKAGSQGGKTGAATGLGPNSVSAYFNASNFEFFIALWQKDKWLSYVLTEGFNEADSTGVAKTVDARL